MSSAMQFAGEYLLNSLWQAPMVAAVAWLLARMLRRLGPEAEHRVWAAALACECVLPACAAPGLGTFLGHLFPAKPAADGGITITLGLAIPHAASGLGEMALRGALVLYLVATVLFALRLVRFFVQLSQLARRAEPLTLSEDDRDFVARCCQRFGVQRVDVATAPGVCTPLTFGTVRPMLLLPRGFVERASSAQLKVALSHELAHVARRDAAKQLLYRLLTLPLQYHPALWWSLAQIAETRERVCDQMAARETGSAGQYARSLLQLASLLTAARPAQANAIGLFDANQFERRVLMITRRNLPLRRSLRVALLAGSALLASACCTTAVALHLNVASPSGLHTDLQVKVAPDIMAGQAVNRTVPKYPADAKKQHISGAVVLNATIGKTGAVQALQVVSGPEELRASALEAVRQWVYKPYLLNGQPTEVETTITVTYSFSE